MQSLLWNAKIHDHGYKYPPLDHLINSGHILTKNLTCFGPSKEYNQIRNSVNIHMTLV
jgi:hypothetical protein